MDIKTIEKARQTAIEMLESRDFTVPLDQQNISRENVAIMLDNNNIDIYVSREAAQAPAKQVVEPETPVEEEIEEGENQEEAAVAEGEAEAEAETDAEAEAEAETEPEVEAEAEAEPEPQVEETVELTTEPTQKGGAHSTQAYVYFHVAAGKFDKKRLVSTVTKIKETYQSNDINIIIIVKEITAPVLKEVDSETYRNVEVFFYKELQSNKSLGSPKHELLTEDEISELATKYSLTPEQFYEQSATMFTTGPMARYYGLRDGDMCRVYRRSKGNGQAIAYRAVRRPILS